jgi:prevent-host-death family protein
VEVGIRELRQNLRKCLDAAKAGEEVVITERGKPVARLVGTGHKTKWQQLVEEGLIRPARRSAEPATPADRVPVEGSVADLVIEDRG